MRYISKYHELALYRNDGSIAHKFKYGELIIGDATTRNGTDLTTSTAGYTVDAGTKSDTTRQIMIVKPDLAGKVEGEVGFNRYEGTGLGSLNKVDNDGDALAALVNGYAGTYFEAPELVNTATLVVGAWYEVLRGTATYKGTTYSRGEKFKVVSGTTSFTGSGTIALSLYPLVNPYTDMTAEHFKIKNLMNGDESTDYWNVTEGGFEPRNSMTSSVDDFYGWMR